MSAAAAKVMVSFCMASLLIACAENSPRILRRGDSTPGHSRCHIGAPIRPRRQVSTFCGWQRFSAAMADELCAPVTLTVALQCRIERLALFELCGLFHQLDAERLERLRRRQVGTLARQHHTM